MLRVPLQGSVAAEDARSLTTGARVRGLSSYVMSDARGSVLATTYLDVFPATFAREAEYDAWGKTLAGYSTLASPKHGFAGAEPDEAVGTYSFGARTYDPSLRRWVSPDPLLAGRPDIDEHLGEALNLYSYADGNPVKKTDKSGFWWPIAVAVAVGTVIGMGAAAPSDTSKAPADILGMALSVIGPPVVSRAIGTAVEKVVLATAEKVAPYLVPTVRAVTAVEKVAPAVAKGEAAAARAAPAAAKAEAPAAAAKATPAAEKAAAEKGVSASAGAGSGRSVENALSGLRAGRNSGVKVVGSADELEGLFGRLTAGGKPAQGVKYPGRLVELPDGTTVGARAASKCGGPTLDIKLPNGARQKVHVE